MNKWQKIFLDHYYKGEMPKDKRGLRQYDLLSGIQNTVSVTFPERMGVNGLKEEHTITYMVSEKDCDMQNGIISAKVLSWQLLTWDRNGYAIESR